VDRIKRLSRLDVCTSRFRLRTFFIALPLELNRGGVEFGGVRITKVTALPIELLSCRVQVLKCLQRLLIP
jgi:hypothetical protein